MKLPVLALAFVVFALGAVACGGGEAAETDGVETTTQSTVDQNGGQDNDDGDDDEPQREEVGHVTNLEKLQLYVDDEPTDSEVTLFARNVLQTDETGLVEFELETGSTCQMLGSTRLVVVPKPGISVKILEGTCWLSKPDEGSDEYQAGDVVTAILSTDTVVGITVAGGEATVKVTRGSADVFAPSGDRVTVMPEQQAVASLSGRLRVEEIRLTGRDELRAKDLERRLEP